MAFFNRIRPYRPNPNWITDRQQAQQMMRAERDRQLAQLYNDQNMDSRTQAQRAAFITGDWNNRMSTANQSQWWEGYSPGLDGNGRGPDYTSGWGSAGNGMALAAMNSRGAGMPDYPDMEAEMPQPRRRPWGGTPFRNMPPDTQKSGTLLTGHRYTKPGEQFNGGGGRPNEGVTVIPPETPYPKVYLPDGFGQGPSDYPEPLGPDSRLDGSRSPQVRNQLFGTPQGGFQPGLYSINTPDEGQVNYEFYPQAARQGYTNGMGNLNNSAYRGWGVQGEGPGAFGQFKNAVNRAKGMFGGLAGSFQKAFYPQPKAGV